MKLLIDTFRSLYRGLVHNALAVGRWYMRRGLFLKIVIAGGLIIVLMFSLSPSEDATDTATATGRFVTLAPVEELAGTDGNAQIIGTVRAVTEADVLAQTGGTVTSVNTRIGATVPAGFVIASLENAAERAAVLSAEGAYDAAVAARDAQSLPDTEKAARDAYRSAYTTIETVLENDLSVFFGRITPYGPEFLVEHATFEEGTGFSRERTRLGDELTALRTSQATAGNQPPASLLEDAEAFAREVQHFLNDIALVVNRTDSGATDEQVDDLASGRTSINGVLSQIGAAHTSLRSGTVGATASADASVKQALGALRSAQANLERTIVRTPVSGQVDFLPIRVGDYVTTLQHVASVSQSGTLEIVAYISEKERDLVTVGESVTIDGTQGGLITSVAPTLDPITKQIEVRIAAHDATGLIGGQSVRVALPNAEVSASSTTSGALFLPLASVKLRTDDRIVFSVDAENRLKAHPVTVGDVRGDRIQILSDLPNDLRIVTDARGLAEGQLVRISGENN